MRIVKSKIIFFVNILMLIMLSTACGYSSGMINPDSKSFVRFSGDFKGSVIYVDELPPIVLEGKSSAYTSENLSSNKLSTHYEIEPGKHLITIKKNGKVVVRREVLLVKGVVKEIRVP